MRNPYPSFLYGLLLTALLGSCQRAEYAFRPAVPTYAAMPVAPTSEPAADAPQASLAAAPASLGAPAQQAAAVLASAPVTGPAPAVVASVPAAPHRTVAPAHEAAVALQPVKRRKGKSSKALWIVLGVGLLLAIVRIATASKD
ncbi:hypothetical protein [Hymenobacter guriensis]|uniref:Uncharacterized protein n=1 Tax=Hymenobacter guriensis TaxID=2793065 RepID=A0ABS0KXC6_9BACT|nr:hypothetical protein [Hymenobacter guriensis]MBG8552506.1 hypothetical protein [Hymenobacter guriensis]